MKDEKNGIYSLMWPLFTLPELVIANVWGRFVIYLSSLLISIDVTTILTDFLKDLLEDLKIVIFWRRTCKTTCWRKSTEMYGPARIKKKPVRRLTSEMDLKRKRLMQIKAINHKCVYRQIQYISTFDQSIPCTDPRCKLTPPAQFGVRHIKFVALLKRRKAVI